MSGPRPELHLLGISFRSADEAVREGLAFSPSQAAALLADARVAMPGVEAVVLSTCNRTEFYLSGLPADELLPRWHQLLRSSRSCADVLADDQARYRYSGVDAYQHLLRVACGLDSALLGDGQILGQVRRAVSLAQEAGTLGGVLSPAFAAALTTGRRARRETTIGVGVPGIGGAVAAALATRQVASDARVVVLGTGEAARAVARALAKAGHCDLVVCGRRREATAAAAARSGATAAAWTDLPTVLAQAEAVVVATGADRPVLDAVPDPVRLVVDAGFPRQVADSVARPGVEVVSLLALTEQVDAAAEQRRSAVPAVEALVAEQVARWERARGQQDLEHAIKELHLEASRATRSAAAQLVSRPGLTEEDVARLLGREVNRLLHGHVSRLRGLTRSAHPPTGHLTAARRDAGTPPAVSERTR